MLLHQSTKFEGNLIVLKKFQIAKILKKIEFFFQNFTKGKFEKSSP